MRYVICLFVLLLISVAAGCGARIRVPEDAGRSFTVQHASDDYEWAERAARKHCWDRFNKMHARHLGTDRVFVNTVLSRFECVAP